MNRFITVKGIGKVSAKPDLIELELTLSRKNMDYNKTMKVSTEAINTLQEAVMSLGFEKKDLKTSDFRVNTSYESVQDSRNNYKQVFDGFVCTHSLKLEFDFDMKKLSDVLSTFAECSAKPEFSVNFSIKDKAAVSEALLVNASNNARQKAEILAKASGVTLGQIITIDYNWGELHLYSPTNFVLFDEIKPQGARMSMDMEPEDIDVSDTVTFVWEIV